MQPSFPTPASTLDFSPERWQQVRQSSRHWWNHTLDRPLIQLRVGGRDPGRAKPELPFYGITGTYDPAVAAEAIVDCWDYQLASHWYLGDAFPSVWPNFGPGVVAAFLGATLNVAPNTIWFHPEIVQEVGELTFGDAFAPENKWLRRIQQICRVAMARWQGLVQVGMTDLGGNLDILSTFRPSEALLLDLYDNPAEVKRLSAEIFRMWWRFYDEINRILQPVNPGYTAWTPIFSEEPYYMFQSDLCYMISPEMFDEFVKPELAASCRRIPHGFYHLDGPGQLPHLDSLLAIDELKGVQWVPGVGQPDIENWPEVYRKIHRAGKLIQIFSHQSKALGYKVLDVIAEQIGTAAGIVLIGGAPPDQIDAVQSFLTRHGAG